MKKKALIHGPARGWDVTEVTTHPGEMLLEEFLKPLGLSANQLHCVRVCLQRGVTRSSTSAAV